MNVPSQQSDTTKAEPDMLQLNMESISKELNELIVTCEQEFGAQQHHPPANITNESKQMPLQTQNQHCQDTVYLINNLYGQPQPQNKDGLQNLKPNLKYFANFPVAQLNYGFNPGNGYNSSIAYYTSPNYLCNPAAASNVSHPILGSSQATTNASATPTYEFHYLKSPSTNERIGFRYNTTMGNRVYRKTPKIMHKYINQKSQTPSSNSENKQIDLSKLDLFKENHDKNKVKHLFDLLRDLHRALAEVPPKFESCSESQYEDTFAPLPSIKSLMSVTLNVQNQVKQACRKLVIFYCELQRIMNANKVYDPNMYAECEYYLYGLHQNINQLEMYKRIEMEHKRGQFLREEVKEHAERLSLLLEQINRQVREVRLRIYAFDWYMSVKYRGEVCFTIQVTENKNHNNNRESVKTPKIVVGVINKILQMCNETTNTKTSAMTTTTNTITNITTATTTAATTTDKPFNSENDRKYSKDVISVKSLLNKNNEILNDFITTDQIKMKAISNSNNNSRHPVFYIG